MEKKRFYSNWLFQLTSEQKQQFYEYLPKKVYTTERNISIVVALLQVCMIFLFLSNKHISFQNFRSVSYFTLYVTLLTATCMAIVLYRYSVRNQKYTLFKWLRRVYALILCFWVIGITFLEQIDGKGLGVYCYLVPTTAAMLLLSPLESICIFGSNWAILVVMLLRIGNENMFGDMVNSIFVTVLALFISYRYYRSTAKEFCDRELIKDQYDEIQKQNNLLSQLVHVDQLTGLYNRHYLFENFNNFLDNKKREEYYAMFLMMDIDYFKQYNDLYGHMQGDVCLKEIAHIIQEHSNKEGASAIRYGGEEFLIVKMVNKPMDAEAFAQQLTTAIKDANIEREDVATECVTVSCGLWYGSGSEFDHMEAAIKKADDALYQAKSAGRNQIKIAM